MSNRLPDAALVCEPIGVIRTPFPDRVSAPRQPGLASDVVATIELRPGKGFEFALEDLSGWQYLWVVFWFHLNSGWRPKVLPPRSDRRRGVFSTRSPHRPNPIGMSVVELLSVNGLVIRVRGADMIDGTPVLDLKPYVPYTDAVPNARTGWLSQPEVYVGEEPAAERLSDDGDPSIEHPAGAVVAPTSTESVSPPSSPRVAERPRDPIGRYSVQFSSRARTQLDWLAACDVHLEAPLVNVLALGPMPHPYRRIRATDTGFRIAMHEWRADFSVQGNVVSVVQIASGYKPQQLAREQGPTFDLHRRFVEAFGRS